MGARGPQKRLTTTGDGELPKCPFSKKERPADHAAWVEIASSLESAGLHAAYAASDFAVVERAAVMLARARWWSDEVGRLLREDDTLYIESRANGIMAHPALREERAAWDVLEKALKTLGMDPRSRAELVTADPEGDEIDELESARSRRAEAK